MINFRIGPVRGIERVLAMLNRLSSGAVDIAVNAFARFMIPFLKNYPAPKHVSRAQAYPNSITIDYGPHRGKVVQGYFSSRQYYYVMLNIKSPYSRTNQTKEGWSVSSQGGGVAYIRNSHAPSKYSMGSDQANLNKLVGWQRAIDIIRANRAGGYRAALKAILAWLGF